MTLKFQLLTPDAKLPTYAHPGEDAAFDIYTTETRELFPGESYAFGTDIASEIPPGHCCLILGKSGLAARYGVEPIGGVIDSGYRGEWLVVIVNHGTRMVMFRSGDKIAQAILIPLPAVEIQEAAELSESARGAAGFGSTGK